MENRKKVNQNMTRNFNNTSTGKMKIEICYSSDYSSENIFELVEEIKTEAKHRGLLDSIEVSLAKFSTSYHDFIVVIDSHVLRENDKAKVIEFLNAELDKRLYAALTIANKDVQTYTSL